MILSLMMSKLWFLLCAFFVLVSRVLELHIKYDTWVIFCGIFIITSLADAVLSTMIDGYFRDKVRRCIANDEPIAQWLKDKYK